MIYRQDRLLSVDKKLVDLCLKVSETWDILVCCGFRSFDEQEKVFKEPFTTKITLADIRQSCPILHLGNYPNKISKYKQ